FLRMIAKALGEYAINVNTDFLHEKRYHGHPTDIAQLQGARLVVVSEFSLGEAMDEARLKSSTGGDRLRGRGIGQDFTEFAPTFVPILQTNNMPVLHSTDDGTWRRIAVVRWRMEWAMPGREEMKPDAPLADLHL